MVEAGAFWCSDQADGLPDLQFHFLAGAAAGLWPRVPSVGRKQAGITVNSYHLQPRSRGSVRLRSANPEDQPTAITYSFVRFFGAQTNMNHGIFQRAERLDLVAASTVVRGLVGIAAFGLAFWHTRSLPLAFLIETVAWFVSYYLTDRIYLIRMAADVKLANLLKVRFRTLVSLLWWVLPLGISLWMIRAANSVPPMVLARYADLAAVGVFGTLAYAHSAISMAMGPMGTASAPRLRRYYKEGNRRAFVSLSLNLVLAAAAFGLIGIAGAWLWGDFVLNLIFGQAYRNATLLTIIVTGTAVNIVGMQIMVTLTAAQAFRERLICSGIGLVAAAVSSLILIPELGIYGAGWTITVMSIARLIYALIVTGRIIGDIGSVQQTS